MQDDESRAGRERRRQVQHRHHPDELGAHAAHHGAEQAQQPDPACSVPNTRPRNASGTRCWARVSTPTDEATATTPGHQAERDRHRDDGDVEADQQHAPRHGDPTPVSGYGATRAPIAPTSSEPAIPASEWVVISRA